MFVHVIIVITIDFIITVNYIIRTYITGITNFDRNQLNMYKSFT